MDAEMQAWLDRLFGETDKYGVDRLMELDEFCPPDNITFQRLAEVFENPAVSLAPYANHRIAQAFWDLSSNVFGDLGRPPEDWDLHMRVFNSFEVLFREFFAVRCEPALGHTSEGGALNTICYMLVGSGLLVLHSGLQFSPYAANNPGDRSRGVPGERPAWPRARVHDPRGEPGDRSHHRRLPPAKAKPES